MIYWDECKQREKSQWKPAVGICLENGRVNKVGHTFYKLGAPSIRRYQLIVCINHNSQLKNKNGCKIKGLGKCRQTVGLAIFEMVEGQVVLCHIERKLHLLTRLRKDGGQSLRSTCSFILLHFLRWMHQAPVHPPGDQTAVTAIPNSMSIN